MEVGVLNMNSVQDEFEETSDGGGSTEELTCSTRIQSGAFSFQNEERDVDMPKDYDRDWNVHVHVENKNKGISIMERSAGKDNERSKELELPEEIHDGVVIIEGKVHFDDIYETPYVNLKIGVAACEDESMCPALDLADSSNLQNAEGDVNMIEEAGRGLDTGVEPVVYSVCQNELEGTSPKCSAEKDKEESCGSDVLETVSCAMLVREVEEASADALLLSAYQAYVKQKTKACYADQPMNPGMGQAGVFGFWMEEGCWIYFIQYANGRMWERSCRDFQIHHVQPD
jgi:hypothetical protein